MIEEPKYNNNKVKKKIETFKKNRLVFGRSLGDHCQKWRGGTTMIMNPLEHPGHDHPQAEDVSGPI